MACVTPMACDPNGMQSPASPLGARLPLAGGVRTRSTGAVGQRTPAHGSRRNLSLIYCLTQGVQSTILNYSRWGFLVVGCPDGENCENCRARLAPSRHPTGQPASADDFRRRGLRALSRAARRMVRNSGKWVSTSCRLLRDVVQNKNINRHEWRTDHDRSRFSEHPASLS